MTTLLLLMAMNLPAQNLKAPELQYFPSSYFDQTASGKLQSRARLLWPGPGELQALWRAGHLNTRQKTALLLGAAAFHDPQIIPIYREGLYSQDPVLAKAAVWGYRSLIGDRLPRLSGEISVADRRTLADEMELVMSSTRRDTLVRMWLTSALAREKKALPAWRGIVFDRSAADSLQSVARLLIPEDLPDVILAYELTTNFSTKISLTRFLEGLCLQRFIIKPRGPRAGWGAKIYDEAFERVDIFLANNCRRGGDRLLRIGLSQIGVQGLDPRSPAACDVWMQILDMPNQSWWPLAAHFMYRCGGPPTTIDYSKRHIKENENQRKYLLRWYGY